MTVKPVWPEQNSKCEPAYECLYAHTINSFWEKMVVSS